MNVLDMSLLTDLVTSFCTAGDLQCIITFIDAIAK